MVLFRFYRLLAISIIEILNIRDIELIFCSILWSYIKREFSSNDINVQFLKRCVIELCNEIHVLNAG